MNAYIVSDNARVNQEILKVIPASYTTCLLNFDSENLLERVCSVNPKLVIIVCIGNEARGLWLCGELNFMLHDSKFLLIKENSESSAPDYTSERVRILSGGQNDLREKLAAVFKEIKAASSL